MKTSHKGFVLKHAVIYCRVSTKEQAEEGNSLTTQEKHCREYTSKHGYDISGIFREEGESAKTTDRKELKRMLAYCSTRKNKINYIIVYKLDRVSRNTDDYSQIRMYLKRFGVEIKSTSEFFEDSPAGRFLENIIANVAQFDNDVRTERSVEGMKAAVLEGRHVWCAPLGYENTKVNGKSTIRPSIHAPCIRLCFQEVVSSLYSLETIRNRMFERGTSTQTDRPVSQSYLYRILGNELYTGWIEKFGLRVRGNFEPIVPVELFNQVQRLLRRRKNSTKVYVNENPDFPLRRFIRLENGSCLTGYWSTGRSKRYPYYSFQKAKRHFRKEQFEDSFIELLSRYALQVNQRNFLDLARVRCDEIFQEPQQQKKNLEESVERIKGIQRLYLEQSREGSVSADEFKEKINQTDEELTAIYSQIYSLLNKDLTTDSTIDGLIKFFTDPGITWKESSPSERLAFQKCCFPRGLLYTEEGFLIKETGAVLDLIQRYKEKGMCSSLKIWGKAINEINFIQQIQDLAVIQDASYIEEPDITTRT